MLPTIALQANESLSLDQGSGAASDLSEVAFANALQENVDRSFPIEGERGESLPPGGNMLPPRVNAATPFNAAPFEQLGTYIDSELGPAPHGVVAESRFGTASVFAPEISIRQSPVAAEVGPIEPNLLPQSRAYADSVAASAHVAASESGKLPAAVWTPVDRDGFSLPVVPELVKPRLPQPHVGIQSAAERHDLLPQRLSTAPMDRSSLYENVVARYATTSVSQHPGLAKPETGRSASAVRTGRAISESLPVASEKWFGTDRSAPLAEVKFSVPESLTVGSTEDGTLPSKSIGARFELSHIPISTSAAVSDSMVPAGRFSMDLSVVRPAELAPQQINVPVQDPAWDTMLSEHVKILANSKFQNAEIRLTPAEMGPLRVQLTIEDGVANVSFQAQHAVTREAIELAMPKLREMLAENGLTLNQANVSGDGVRHGERDNDKPDPGSTQAVVNSEVELEERAEARNARPGDNALVDTFV